MQTAELTVRIASIAAGRAKSKYRRPKMPLTRAKFEKLYNTMDGDAVCAEIQRLTGKRISRQTLYRMLKRYQIRPRGRLPKILLEDK